MGDEMLTGYLAGQADGGNNNGGFGGFGEGLWAVIILAMLFGNGGFGFGGFGGFGGGGFINGALTRAELYDGFATQNIDSAVRGVQQGICDSTYALTNAINGGFNSTQMGMMQGFNGVERGFCDIGHQISDCCCTTQRAIDGVSFNLSKGFCDLGNVINMQTRDLIDNQNANYRSIMDFMVQEKLSSKDAQIAQLQNRISQLDQNAFITANQEAQTAELIRRLRTPEAVPAYVVPNPNCCYGNPVGIGYGYNQNSCGCGCGC